MENKNEKLQTINFSVSGKGKSKINSFWNILSMSICKQLREKYTDDYKDIIKNETITDWVEKRGVVIDSWDKAGNIQKGGVEALVKSVQFL